MSEHAFESQVALAWPTHLWHGFRLILAVSGGADSVALLRAIHHLRAPEPGRLLVAHFNHRLRGNDSDEDARFVAKLAQSLGMECVVGSAPPADVGGAGGEAEARGLRYAFLEDTARRFGARYVVTAHTADDQAETVLHHILRGTGLAGLAGMPRVRTLGDGLALVRPLLGVGRADILSYLAALDQSYREDATNRDPRFTRNRIRHELLPQLKQDYSPSIVESLLRLGSLAADAQRVIGRQVEQLAAQGVLERSKGSITLDASVVSGEDPHLVRELFVVLWRQQQWPLQEMSFAHWTALAELAQQVEPRDPATTRLTLPGAIRAERRADRIVLTALSLGGGLAPGANQA